MEVRPESANGSVELYDLEADNAERTDLADAHPELVQEFEKWPQDNRTEPPDQPARSAVGYKDYIQLAPIDPAAMGTRNRPRK